MEQDLSVRPVGICHLCAHFVPAPDGTATCAAFPAGIPEPVRFGTLDHRSPLPGDNGVRFEPLGD